MSSLLEHNIDILSSYFTKHSLRPGEFEINESMLLNSNMQIFDSRLLINAKLQDLYFFTNKGSIRWNRHELVTAESFIIMDEEMRLRRLGLYEKYDTCRDDACRSRFGSYLKLPNVSSVCDNLISPSGHGLRMMTACLDGRCSIGMFILKIIYSFYKVRSSWITYPATQSTNRIFGISLNLVDGYGGLLDWSVGLF